jgi:rhodanese-related sulfurtransferase
VDAGGFGLLATVALCGGLLLNQFRDRQLPLVYRSKAGRVAEAVRAIQNTENVVAARAEAGLPGAGLPGAGLPEVALPEVALPAPALPEAPAPQPISLEDFREQVSEKRGLILDARPEIFYEIGHVPGAVSFPREEFDKAYLSLRSRLEPDRSQLLMVYCSGGDCEDSQMVADGLSKLGYRRIYVFKGGWGAWQQAHLPEEKSE